MLDDPKTTREILEPMIVEKVDKLADVQPGIEAKSIASEILTLIRAILTDPTIAPMLPTGWKLYISAAVAGITLLLSGGLIDRVFLAPSPTMKIAGCQCGCVTGAKCICKDCDHPQITKPAPVTPTSQSKIVIYSADTVSSLAVIGDPKLKDLPIKMDPKTYAATDGFQFGGKTFMVPFAVYFAGDGAVVDVASAKTPADVAALWAKNSTK